MRQYSIGDGRYITEDDIIGTLEGPGDFKWNPNRTHPPTEEEKKIVEVIKEGYKVNGPAT